MENQALGAIWSKEKTLFRLFSPQTKEVTLNLYDFGEGGQANRVIPMERDGSFVWTEVEGDLDGQYYTYTVDGVETIDPYAKSAGANGKRGFIFDPISTDPDGWAEDHFDAKMPIVWEVHVRDFSSAIPMREAGKYLGFKTGVKTPEGRTALVDYLKELGITYVHLLPVMDYVTVDEKTVAEYNWGYDPASYFYPEGSYSLNPYDGRSRVKELKTLIKTLHENGIGIVLDVVYNHVYKFETSSLQKCAPDYYFRKNGGKYANGSGCGNETASERTMMRKLMIDSTTYWAKEYHVDGFRFDLMGLHDVQTMNRIRASLDQLPNGRNILMYGEPWYCSPPQGVFPADMNHATLLDDRIAIFNPELRDGIRGSNFHQKDQGYIQGNTASVNRIKTWIAGGNCAVEYNATMKIKPSQQVAYAASHDDYSLFDKLMESTWPGFDGVKAHKFSAFILLSCLGMPFFQAGEEFLRTKNGNKNSYNAGDRDNHLDWSRRDLFDQCVQYYRGLIAIRKQNKEFLTPNCADFRWVKCNNEGAAAYTIGDYLYCFNNTNREVVLETESFGTMVQLADIDRTDLNLERHGKIVVPAYNVFLAKKI